MNTQCFLQTVVCFVAIVLPADDLHAQSIASNDDPMSPAAKTATVWRKDELRKIKSDFWKTEGQIGKGRDAIRKRFLSVDVNTLSPEWRYEFLSALLHDQTIRGDWDGIKKVRDKIMASDDRATTRSLLDADLLLTISRYFENTVIVPPGVVPPLPTPRPKQTGVVYNVDLTTGSIMSSDGSKMDVFKYYDTHYRDEREAVRIRKYIIDRFDPNYVVTAQAVGLLAEGLWDLAENEKDPEAAGKLWREAYQNFQKLGEINLDSLYGAQQVDTGGGYDLAPAEKHRNEKIDLLISYKEDLPKYLMICASGLPKDEAIRELKSLAERYKDNREISAKIAENLARLTGRSLP